GADRSSWSRRPLSQPARPVRGSTRRRSPVLAFPTRRSRTSPTRSREPCARTFPRAFGSRRSTSAPGRSWWRPCPPDLLENCDDSPVNEEVGMDWIEQLFGISPDAGSGALEALIAGALVAVVLGLALAIRAQRSR